MNVLFLNLPDPPDSVVYRDYCGGFGSAFPKKPASQHNLFPPLFDAYAAAFLEKSGYTVKILDCQAQNFTSSRACEEVEKQKPDVVVSRICLPSFESDTNTIALIKEKLSETVFVGWGSICKVEPEKVLKKSELDIVIRGELEFVVPDVLKALSNQTAMDKVTGISFKASGEITHNEGRLFLDDLNLLPFPACHLLPMNKYVARESYFVSGGSDKKYIPFFRMLASRGCSFNCIYCPYPTIFERWRGLSPKRVVDELEYLVNKHGVRTIWFQDQVFTMSLKRTVEICDEIINRGLDVIWACQTRIDKLPADLIRKMRAAGCSKIEVGVETGNQHLLRKIGKQGLTIEKVKATVKKIREEGIMVEANFIVGLPGESWKTVKDTGKLIRSIHPDDMAISILTPYPGTPLYKTAEENGWIIEDDWSRYNTSNAVLSLPDFSDEDAKRAQRYLYRVYSYTQGPKALKRLAKSIVNKFS